jgi:hypothetical protein
MAMRLLLDTGQQPALMRVCSVHFTCCCLPFACSCGLKISGCEQQPTAPAAVLLLLLGVPDLQVLLMGEMVV